ncbi:hypothetical protein [Legionella maioricensis]|uniref:Uncharacterized protein n=1 Tax=Legionella maioricensis TaxID=2896528 RepID=A0A9X2CXK0_9GAMM|nr:hypothetical protein [Legionella maioricensis]MCL9682561.1 hypothetical protein [Legionella maioricensis]MCL9686192.1 hypothetical protein [Legionella maioricensis]
MQNKQPTAQAKKIMGEIEIKNGNTAYNNTTGIYGLFAVADRVQSAVTGLAITNEVAQIRNGERLQAEAEKVLSNKSYSF